jgi:hypothetical protein
MKLKLNQDGHSISLLWLTRSRVSRIVISLFFVTVSTIGLHRSLFAWNQTTWHPITSGRQNTFALNNTAISTLINPVSGSRYIYGGYSYTWWNSTAVNWLKSQSNYTALVFHVFRPNSMGACPTANLTTNTGWGWGNLPGLSVYQKTCSNGIFSVVYETRLVATNNNGISANTNYWGQAVWNDTQSSSGEMTFDTYLVYWWAPTISSDNEFITKHCFNSTNSTYLPTGGSC